MSLSRKERRQIGNIFSAPHNIVIRFPVIGILITLFVLTLGVWNSTAADKTPYVIGGIVSVTGQGADWGTQLAEGEAFTVKLWMDKGGIKGFPIKYIFGDDECKTDRTLIIAKKLVTKDNVLAIAAGGLTAGVTAISPYVNEIGVPCVFSAGGKTLLLPKEKFLFDISPNTPIVQDYNMKWFKNKGITRLALVADNTAYGQEIVAYEPGVAKRYGVDLVTVERYDIEDMDMTAMLSRVKAKKPEAILLGGYGEAAVRILKQRLQIELNVPIVLPVACVDNIFIKNLGSTAMGKTNIYADGNYLMTLDEIPNTDPRKIKSKAFVEAFEKEYKKKFNYGNGVGYDEMETVLRAIEAVAPFADKIDYKNVDQLKKIRADIRTWLENAKGLELLTGTFSRSPEDHVGMRDLGKVRIIDGKWMPTK